MKKNRLICMVVLLRLLLLGAAAGVAYYVLSDKDYVSYSHGDDEDDDDHNRLYTRKIIKEVEGKRCVFYLYSYNRYSSYDDPDLADYCSEDYYSIDNLQIMWPQSFEGHDISGLQKELLNAISNLNWPGAQGKGAREDYNSIDSLYMGWVTALNENYPVDTIPKIPDDAEPYRIYTDSTRVSVVWHNDRVISYELFHDVYRVTCKNLCLG